MALQRDWILRIIEQLGEALGRWRAGGSQEDVESALEALTGLSVDQLDVMPAPLLLRMVQVRSDRITERIEAMAQVLESLAELSDPTKAAGRQAKAQALRRAL